MMETACSCSVPLLQLRQELMESAMQHGYIMLIAGFVIGLVMPRIAAYMKVKYGRSAE